MSALRTAVLRKPKADGRDRLRVDGVGASLLRILEIGLPSAVEVGAAGVKLSAGGFFRQILVSIFSYRIDISYLHLLLLLLLLLGCDARPR